MLDGELFLTSLHIGLPPKHVIRAQSGKGPEKFGVLPTADRFSGFLYEGFKSPIPFTGGLILAHDFIPELYVQMGFYTAWKYKTVREVIFDEGRITDDFDRSSDMAATPHRAPGSAGQSRRSPGEPRLGQEGEPSGHSRGSTDRTDVDS